MMLQSPVVSMVEIAFPRGTDVLLGDGDLLANGKPDPSKLKCRMFGLRSYDKVSLLSTPPANIHAPGS